MHTILLPIEYVQTLASAVMPIFVLVAVGICFEALDVNRRGVIEFSEFEKATHE